MAGRSRKGGKTAGDVAEVVRTFEWGVYGISFLLIAFPIIEAIVGAWPPRVGVSEWRYGFIGTFSRAFTGPLLGVMFVLMTAVVCERRLLAYFLSWICLTWTGIGVVFLGVFALDGMQTWAAMPAEVTAPFIVSNALAVGRYLFGMAASLALGIAGLRLLGSSGRAPQAATPVFEGRRSET